MPTDESMPDLEPPITDPLAPEGDAPPEPGPDDVEAQAPEVVEPEPEPEQVPARGDGPIALLIAPGPENIGAVVSFAAPYLDGGEWVPAKFFTLDFWSFTPEGNPEDVAGLSKTPIRFRFQGGLGEVRLAGKKKPLTIDPSVDDLVNFNGPNQGRVVAVRAIPASKDGPILEVDLSPAAAS